MIPEITKEEWEETRKEIIIKSHHLYQGDRLVDSIKAFVKEIDTDDKDLFIKKSAATFFVVSQIKNDPLLEELTYISGKLLKTPNTVDEDSITKIIQKCAEFETKIANIVRNKKFDLKGTNENAGFILSNIIKSSNLSLEEEIDKIALVAVIFNFAERSIGCKNKHYIKTTDVGLA